MEHTETIYRLPLPAPRGDQVVVLRGIPWAQYDAICRAREDSAGPRMAYLDGDLEIMSPSPIHEGDKKLIARLVEAYCDENEIALNGFGSTTYRRKAKEAGVEPDECYCIGPAKNVPDFAIEVVHTSGGIEKLEIYRRLRIPEVWFWAKGRFFLYGLEGKKYVERARSQFLPDLDLRRIADIVRDTDGSHQSEAVRGYRRGLRKRK